MAFVSLLANLLFLASGNLAACEMVGTVASTARSATNLSQSTELSKSSTQSQKNIRSHLCAFFGLPQKVLELPLVAQDYVVRHIMRKYPHAFEWTMSKPTMELRTRPLSLSAPREVVLRDAQPTYFGQMVGHQRFNCNLPENLVSDVVFINKGNTMVTSSDDGSVEFRDVPSLQIIRNYALPMCWNGALTVPRQRSVMAFNEDESLLAISLGTSIHIYKTRSFELIGSFDAQNCVSMLAFLKDLKQLLVVPQRWGKPGSNFVRIFNISDGTIYHEFNPQMEDILAALSPDKTKLALYERSLNIFQLWDLSKDLPVVLYRAPFTKLSIQLYVDKMYFLDDENLVLSQMGHLYLVNLKDEVNTIYSDSLFKKIPLSELPKMQVQSRIDQSNMLRIMGLAFDREHQHLLVAFNDGTMNLYSAATGKKIMTYINPQGRLMINGRDYYDTKLEISCAVSNQTSCMYYGALFKKPEIFQTSSIWVPLIPEGLQNGAISVLQGLFIIVAQAYKHEYPNVNVAFNALEPEIKSELIDIFLSFTKSQQEFLKKVFFAR